MQSNHSRWLSQGLLTTEQKQRGVRNFCKRIFLQYSNSEFLVWNRFCWSIDHEIRANLFFQKSSHTQSTRGRRGEFVSVENPWLQEVFFPLLNYFFVLRRVELLFCDSSVYEDFGWLFVKVFPSTWIVEAKLQKLLSLKRLFSVPWTMGPFK